MLAAHLASVRVNPGGHRGRVGLRIIWDDDAFPLRDLLGVQQLSRAHQFWVEFPGRFTISCLGRVFAEKFAAD